MGVLQVRAPDGRVWWVKRGWVPRYRTLRESVALHLAGTPRHWYTEPLRWAAGPPLYRDVVPTGSPLAVGSMQDGERSLPGGDRVAADVASAALNVPWNLPVPSAVPFDPGPAVDLTSQAAARLLDVGGGSTMPGDVGSFLVGGGSSIPGDLAGAAAGPSLDVGGGDGGGGGGGGGDGLPIVVVALLVLVALVAALAVLWFVVVPLVLAFADIAALVTAALLAGLVRLVLRRPWDVLAVEDLQGGMRRIRRWEVRGFRRAGHVRDDVAQALTTGTDPELAVVRALLREPRDDDPAGSARSVTEIEGREPNPAQHVLGVPPARPRRRARPADLSAWDDLEEALELVDEASGARGGEPDPRYSPAELRTALKRIDERALAIALGPGSQKEQDRRAVLRERIRQRLEASAGTRDSGPTSWFEDPRDGRIWPG